MSLNIVLLGSLALMFVVAVSSDERAFVHSHFLVPCNYTEIPGASCLDCNRRLICTKIGGIILPCLLPGRHCIDDGQCTSEPSEECAPSTQSTVETSSITTPTQTTTSASSITPTQTTTSASSTTPTQTTTSASSTTPAQTTTAATSTSTAAA